MPHVTATTIPPDSLLQPQLASADFYDAFTAPLHDQSRSPVDIYLRASRATPGWVNLLMDIRNAMVRPFGLKTPARLAEPSDKPVEAYKIGDRISIFTILALTDDELVMGIDDTHLDVRISIMKQPGRYVLSSVVATHNCLGRLYMLPVGPMHKLVVRGLMRGAAV